MRIVFCAQLARSSFDSQSTYRPAPAEEAQLGSHRLSMNFPRSSFDSHSTYQAPVTQEPQLGAHRLSMNFPRSSFDTHSTYQAPMSDLAAFKIPRFSIDSQARSDAAPLRGVLFAVSRGTGSGQRVMPLQLGVACGSRHGLMLPRRGVGLRQGRSSGPYRFDSRSSSQLLLFMCIT